MGLLSLATLLDVEQLIEDQFSAELVVSVPMRAD
jgi:hypothetical protein